MPLKIKKSQPKSTVSKQNSSQGKIISEEQTQETLNVPSEVSPSQNDPVKSTPCTVRFEAGYTHNLGDFNSTKVLVGIEIPCEHAEINEVYDFGKDWVNERLTSLVEEIQGSSE